MSESTWVTHQGSCHCGLVRFAVKAPAKLTVNQCNCSICSCSGYLGIMVEPDCFQLLSGEESLQEYTFNTGRARHLFCGVCGIKSFYIPRSHPHLVNINARCLDPDLVEELVIRSFDGQNWERYYSDHKPNPLPE